MTGSGQPAAPVAAPAPAAPASSGARPAGKLDGVQALRAFAAMMVVVGHVVGAVRHHPETFGQPFDVRIGGGVGVDVFFLISGFIMVYASRSMFGRIGGSADFMLRRFVRIAPLYWGVTGLALALLVVGGKDLPAVAGIAASFGFVPFDTYARGDGFAFPIVDLGWTLNYEMMFYVVFALFIPLGRRRCVVAVTIAMVVLVAIGLLVAPDASAPRFWTQPIVLEFVAGMWLAMAHMNGRLVLPVMARVLLAAAAVALHHFDPFGLMRTATTPNSFLRCLSWGVPAAFLLIATVAGPLGLRSLAGRLAVLLGDASYALYLLHPFVLVVMLRIFALPGMPLAGRGALFVATTLAAAAAGSIVVHRLIERPVTTALTRRLQRRGAPIAAVPLPPDAPLRR